MREHQEKVPFDYIVDKFSKMDPNVIATTLGIPYNETNKSFVLEMMKETYKVFYPSGKVYTASGEEITSYVLKTIIVRYLVNGKGTSLTGKYITYKEIKDGQIYYPNFYKRTILRLSQLYSENKEVFRKNAELVKAKFLEQGDLSFSFDFMKNVNFLFVFYDEDEEFDASANILMDQNIEDYYNAEDLAVVVDVAIEYFLYGYIPRELGMYSF
ncbi:DUF3786 domain-containing protein [Alkalibaculum bacchi]|uniref:DUF3786 domain-containing protein n=1 Tax=Alkalibaculum bacchi TaxID=645887 RepID=UPI0026ECC593|nr:DUF3786 domain-containing protein [Alkalibaculum bacchi]